MTITTRKAALGGLAAVGITAILAGCGAAPESTAGGTGGAIQGDSSEGGTGGAIQGDADPERRTSLGGDESTEEQLGADNEVEEDSLKTLDPDDPPA